MAEELSTQADQLKRIISFFRTEERRDLHLAEKELPQASPASSEEPKLTPPPVPAVAVLPEPAKAAGADEEFIEY